MSFGFSIGDFLTVIELANKIRKEFAGAPSQFKAINDEVRSLSFVLQDVEVDLSGKELSDSQKAELQAIADSCRCVLDEIYEEINIYRVLESDHTTGLRKVVRVWKRLKWEPEDIQDLRTRISSNISLLNAFNGRITRGNVAGLLQRQDDRERQEILDWLSPRNYTAQQSDYLSRSQPGTGQWLIDSNHFRTWLEKPEQTLFCPGIPGAGKTTLMSLVIDELYKRYGNDREIGIVFIYFKFKDEWTMDQLLSTLLKQLVQRQQSIPNDLKDLYDDHYKHGTRPPPEEISRCLHTIASAYKKLFIVIDALDECQSAIESRDSILPTIFNLQAQSHASLLATSRPIPEVSDRFKGMPTLEIRARSEDVQRYLRDHLGRLPRFVSRDAGLQNEIVTEITEAVDGMFLLAQLHLDSLVGKMSPRALRNALKQLPTGTNAVSSAYRNAMSRIEGQVTDQVELAKQVLSWVVCAKQQLTVLQLQHALAVEIGESYLDQDNFPEVEDMISVCAGLVTTDTRGGIVRLVHHTAQTYFEQTWMDWFPDAHSKIAATCITYLSFDIYKTEFQQTLSMEQLFGFSRVALMGDFEAFLKQYPLYTYSARYWATHCYIEQGSHELVLSLLRDETKSAACGQALAIREEEFWCTSSAPLHITGSHLAVYFGLEDVLQGLIETSSQANTADANGETPLSWAIRRGNELCAKLLLEKGADPNTRDKHDRTPLSRAAGQGCKAMVKLLLDNCADPSIVDRDGKSSLSWAAAEGHDEVVRLHLEKNVNLESKDKDGQTPLSWAAKNGYSAVVDLLLKKGADPFVKDNKGGTPISWAFDSRDTPTVRLLLSPLSIFVSRDGGAGDSLILRPGTDIYALKDALVGLGVGMKQVKFTQLTERLYRAPVGGEWLYIKLDR
ncbi:hypothetical protein ANOM_006429 [Aspergillus nomiae NRRL 13137]|uniref:NACHT domain-containing protein n=1 Tax=Aspergillus nomiae NRRL (strain ATCC 15546 / NRRL 13137 / CBS 260.88 / M93) TaxID=1509407 RepID=A0A0L1IYM0_ASPN3|nr:uncharacterized protein ANOM_006429 [Aspergillus nomiae NRRL 13137]KNG84604.1 hypothetical protein ANOM_006429 [Aspergillus nomiae NRRL 13137]